MSKERAPIGIAVVFILVMAIFFLILRSEPQNTNSDDNLGPSSFLRPPHTANITSSRNPNNDSMSSNIINDNPASPLLLWSDEFAGSELSQDDWSYEYDTIESLFQQQEQDKEDIHFETPLFDQGKTELEFYDSHAVSVKDGFLTIGTRQVINAAVPFVSGRIKTQDKLLFQYGTIEARIRLNSGCQDDDDDDCVSAGYLSPSFWTRGSGSASYGQPTRGQVDIFSASIQTPTRARRSSSKDEALVPTRADEEGDTKVSSEMTQSITGHQWKAQSGATWITTIANDDVRLIEKSFHNDYPLDTWKDQDFHVYKFDWTPTRMATFIDEELAWEMDITDGSCGDCQAFHRPHYLLLGISVTESPSWSSPSSSVLALNVDYIRLLDNGFASVSHPET